MLRGGINLYQVTNTHSLRLARQRVRREQPRRRRRSIVAVLPDGQRRTNQRARWGWR